MSFRLNRSTVRAPLGRSLSRGNKRFVCRKFPDIEIAYNEHDVYYKGQLARKVMVDGIISIVVDGYAYRFCDIHMWTFDYPEYTHSAVCAIDGNLNNVTRENLFWARLIIEDREYLESIIDFVRVDDYTVKGSFAEGFDGYLTVKLYSLLTGSDIDVSKRQLEYQLDYFDEAAVLRRCGRIMRGDVVSSTYLKDTYSLDVISTALVSNDRVRSTLETREEIGSTQFNKDWDIFLEDIAQGWAPDFYINERR